MGIGVWSEEVTVDGEEITPDTIESSGIDTL